MNDYFLHHRLRVFTTFSGYDSQCLALNRLKERFPGFDYELVGWAEIDKNAIKAHDLLFPEARNLNRGDISRIDWTTVPDFDLLTYSSPCQTFSLAGDMSGGAESSGTKSALLWEIRKCIEVKRPKYMILENVYTLLSGHHIDVFRRWVDVLTGYGYDSAWQILNAKQFGIPQNRDRVFLVSVRRDGGEADWPDAGKAAVQTSGLFHTETGTLRFDFPTGRRPDVRISDFLDPQPVAGSYYMPREKVAKWITENERRIREYILERNDGVEDVRTAGSVDETGFINETLANINDMPRKKKLTEEDRELLLEQETDEQTAREEAAEFDSSFDVTPASAEETDKPAKPIIEYLTPEDRKRRGRDRCILRIPTPTCSDGSAPTIMATGYASADYKNFYSVGHFPKLAVFEVWHHEPDEDATEAENALY